MSNFTNYNNASYSNNNNDNMKNPRNKKPTNPITKRLWRIFMKSFLITTVIFFAIVGSVRFAWSRAVAPPAIQAMGHIPVPQSESDGEQSEEVEYYYEEEPEVEYIWPAPERFTDDDRRELFWTFLIIGLNEGRNANTVMVASYCGVNNEANLISIPRDVPINPNRSGHAQKLSSSYLAGAGGGRGRDGGIARVQMDVMNVIGFIPDYYVLIDYETFFTIIDAVGGIDVYVPIRMRYSDPHQNLEIDLQPGMQHMDSATALEFVRFRQSNRNSPYPSLPDGDIGRTRNQQAVINAVISSLLTPASILRIPDFVSIFNDSVHTNMNFREMMFFALELNNIRGTDALSTDTFVPARSSGRPYYFEFLSPTGVLEIVNNYLNPFKHNIELRDLNIATG